MQYHVRPTTDDGATVLAQVGGAVFGHSSIPFYRPPGQRRADPLPCGQYQLQRASLALAAILAQDGYVPRQFAFRGDRLAFSWGIVVLAAVAVAMLVVPSDADTHALIPLYSVGVFICFTLSQTGMVIHWRKERSPGWAIRGLVNGFGAVLTGVVFLVVADRQIRATARGWS